MDWSASLSNNKDLGGERAGQSPVAALVASKKQPKKSKKTKKNIKT
jgi:hypothetical protein